MKVAKESFDATVKFFNINSLPKDFNQNSDGTAKITGFRVTEDLNDIEISRIERFVANADDPTKKRMVIARYGIEESRVADLFLKARDLQFKEAKLVVDINRAVNINYDKWPIEEYKGKNPKTGKMDYLKQRPAKYLGDIDQALRDGVITWKNNDMAKTIQKLLDEGYKLNPNRSKYGIYSPGIYYDKKTIIPIMHLKEVFLVSEGIINGVKQQIIRYSEATLNWSKKMRHNRLISYKATNFIPKISATNMNRASYSFAHIKETIKAFSNGEQYKEVGKRFQFPRVRFLYEDGSWQEPMYNLGKYNQNDRAVDILQNKVKKIASLTMSHFVSTNTPLFKELIKSLSLNSEFKLKGILDAKFFGWLNSFGLFHGLAGYSTIRPWGIPNIYVDPDEVKGFRDQIEMKVYARIADGQRHNFADQYPLVENLWHDKSHYFEYLKSKEADIFYGSMNASNNSANTDLQTHLFLPNKGKSDFFKANKAISTFLEDKRRTVFQKHLLTLEEAVFKNSFVYFTGLGYDEVSNDRVRKAYGSLKNKNIQGFFSILEELRDMPRDHMIGLEKSSKELVDLRIRKLKNIFKLYRGLGKDYQIGMRYWVPYIMLAMSNPKLSTKNIKQLINLSIYKPSASSVWENPQEGLRYMKDIWKEVRPTLEAKIAYFELLNQNEELTQRLKRNLGEGRFKTEFSRDEIIFFPNYNSIRDIRDRMFSVCGSELTVK